MHSTSVGGPVLGLYFRSPARDTVAAMRLGLLGPARGDVGALGRAAELLLNDARVHRAVYLGKDAALDRAVSAWARKLVGGDPSDDAAWTRALGVAIDGTAQQIDRFVASERARQRLKALETLPSEGAQKITIGNVVAVLHHDDASLDDATLRAADIVLFGRSERPMVRQIGPRWFVSPAAIGTPSGGIAVLDDEHDGLSVTIYDTTGKPAQRETLTWPRANHG